ncbi:hypothetical protein BG003_002822 [Podila horticola]|nr:hypothetical protein BG003_002822 [Podila horticola]
MASCLVVDIYHTFDTNYLPKAVLDIFCQARYITNVATCVIGVKECNAVERFNSCVCENSGNRPTLRLCLVALLADPSFRDDDDKPDDVATDE